MTKPKDRDAWGGNLRRIVSVEPDGTVVLSCGHKKKPKRRLWGARTYCPECFPESPPRPWPLPKKT